MSQKAIPDAISTPNRRHGARSRDKVYDGKSIDRLVSPNITLDHSTVSKNKNRYSRLNRSINVGEGRVDVSNLNADIGGVSPKSKLPQKISNDPVK